MQVWILQKSILILTAHRWQKLLIGYRQEYGQLHNLKVYNREIYSDVIKHYLEFKDAIPVISSNNLEDNF